MSAKKLLGVLVIACMLLSMLPVVSSAASAGDTFTAGDFTYTVNDDTSTVTLTAIAAASLSGEVVIPSTVTDGTSTFTVTKLGAAFKGTDTAVAAKTHDMTKLVMADTITTITTTSPFYACRFTEIHLSSNLDTSNHCLEKTFNQCNLLYTVNIPAKITGLKQTFPSSGQPSNLIFEGTATRNFYMNDSTNKAYTGSKAINIYTPYVANQSSLVSNISGTAGTLTPTYYYYEGDYRYTVKGDGTARMFGLVPGKTAGATMNIPSTLGGKTVSELYLYSMRNNTVTTSFTMPDTVTTIDSGAFYGWSNLTSVHLSTALTNAPNAGKMTNTFHYCSKLTAVEIPAGITMCYGTFLTNCAVRTVTILGRSSVNFYGNSSTTEARAWANGTTGITIKYPQYGTAPSNASAGFTATVSTYSVTFTAGNFTYKVTGSTTATLTGVADGVTLSGAVTVPSTATNANDIYTYTVTAIGNQALNGKAAVTALTLPNTVTTIGYQAFMEMDGLTSFEMPDSVTTIGYGLFHGCNNLADVKLSKNLTGTMQTTFAYCPSLKGCVIPSGVTTLNRTFMYCNIIKTVYVPASVTTITGDDVSDIRSRLFSTFDTNGTITGAPTEPGFIVMGPAGSAIETYMNGKGWNFKAVDTNMELALSDPVTHLNQTVTVDVVNFKNTDETTQKFVFGAYYDKTTGDMTDVGFENLGTVEAVDLAPVTITMQTGYNASNVLARAFVWAVGSLAPLADYSELNEVQ